MKAVTYASAGHVLDVVEYGSIPDPAPLAPGDLLVRILTTPVHRGDLLIQGSPVGASFARRGMGIEGAGVVVATGERVTRFQVGDRVAVFPAPGSWADLVKVHEAFAVKIPDRLRDDLASISLVNTVTARMVLRTVISATDGAAGRDVPLVVSAAASAVGRLIVELAVSDGRDVVAVTRSASSTADFRDAFPEIGIVPASGPEWPRILDGLLNGRPAPGIVDAYGGRFAGQLLKQLAPGGTLVVSGDLDDEPMDVKTADLLTSNLTIRGVSIVAWTSEPETVRRGDQEMALSLAKTRPELFQIAGGLPLHDVRDAIRGTLSPGKAGTFVLHPSEH